MTARLDFIDDRIVELFELLGQNPVFSVCPAPGFMHLVLIEKILPHPEPKDVP